MKTLLLILSLFASSTAMADGVLTPAANPPQPTTVLLSSGIPFIKASSGSMGNNGAVSGLATLPKTYSSGAYLYLPASAISAGSAAGWYWFVASSATAGTVYNSTYTSGIPRPGTATAFATTGPGAFTGTTSAVTAWSVTLPANLMGINGTVDVQVGTGLVNIAGGNKIYTVSLGAGTIWTVTAVTHTSMFATMSASNRGVLTAQTIRTFYDTSSSTNAGAVGTDLAINTAANSTVSMTLQCSNAGDHAFVENYRVLVYSSN